MHLKTESTIKLEETGVETINENTGGSYEESISLNNVEVSEATKQFVADVASVEFSSPELVWVGKVDETFTVGGLKEANGLEVQYSAELSEEQIAEINSSTVEAGDWALVSVLPFTSEESLTVTMKNGEVFTVKVTDAQISSMFLSDSGELFEVTVTYNDDAKIPEGATLKVTEFDEYSLEFQNAWKVITGENYFSDTHVAETASEETPDGDAEASEELPDDVMAVSEEIKTFPAGMAAMDITIYDSEGHEVEPKAPVTVSIVMKSLPEDLDIDEFSETAAVHHLNETPDGTVEEIVAACNGTVG